MHPDDEMAKRLHDKNGKSEMWYVLDAYINNMDKSLLNKVSRFLHISMR